MGWNHHLVLFIMIHPPFDASWGHVFVITLLLNSTDIILYIYILNTSSAKRLCHLLWPYKIKIKTQTSQKKTPPRWRYDLSPLRVVSQPFPPFCSSGKGRQWRHSFHGALWLDLEDLSNSAKEGGSKRRTWHLPSGCDGTAQFFTFVKCSKYTNSIPTPMGNYWSEPRKNILTFRYTGCLIRILVIFFTVIPLELCSVIPCIP